MTTVPDEFLEWVKGECDQRHWSWNECSSRAGLARSSISGWVNGEKYPGLQACLALVRLFRVPGEHVLRLAGHLPPLPDPDAQLEQLRFLFETMTPEQRDELLFFARMILDRDNRAKNKPDLSPSVPSEEAER